MKEITFTKNFGAITVTIDGNNGQITVQGPKAYIEGINWDSIYESARILGPHAASSYMAIALAVQMNYAAWHGLQSLPSTCRS